MTDMFKKMELNRNREVQWTERKGARAGAYA